MPSLSGTCDPIAPPTGGGNEPVRGRIYELSKLGPEAYRAVAITLFAALTNSTLTGQATYRVPATHNLAIEAIVGHLALIDAANETADMGTIGSSAATGVMDFKGRALVKAMNCYADLKNSDREAKIFENKPVRLSTILTALGGMALDFAKSPHIVPAGETIQLDVGLTQSTAAIGAGSTEYGVVLIGQLVRVARS